MLAPKCALAIRVDALGEETNTELGLEHRAKLEHRMERLEDKVMTDVHSLINLFR
jgi:nucleolar protein 58